MIQKKKLPQKVAQHLLVCPETLFSNNLIGMPHFVENLQQYNLAYDKTKVVIAADKFKLFFLIKQK